MTCEKSADKISSHKSDYNKNTIRLGNFYLLILLYFFKLRTTMLNVIIRNNVLFKNILMLVNVHSIE